MGEVVTRAELAQRIDAARPNGRVLLVGIDGRGGAGKTTLARWLALRLEATVVCSDEFARPGLPEWDWRRFAEQVLAPLRERRLAKYQRYDWALDRPGEWVEIPAAGVLIAEGVSITRRELGDPWDLRVWVECPFDVRLARVAERDALPLEGKWIQDWVAEEGGYVVDQRPDERADVVVSGAAPVTV